MRLKFFVTLLPFLLACDPEQHRHLHCTDAEGIVVVDTTDLIRAPLQGETMWSWRNKPGTEYSQLSIPPHNCIYKQHKIPRDDPDKEFPCDASPEDPQRDLEACEEELMEVLEHPCFDLETEEKLDRLGERP